MVRLLGKTAIVTGANSGMGFATSKALLDEGATVTISELTVRRDLERL